MFVFNWTAAVGIQYFAVTMVGGYPGANPYLSYILASIMMFATSIAAYYLTIAMPRSGGAYIYVSRVIHPAIGFLTGWSYFLYFVFACAVVCIVAPTVLSAGLIAAGYVMKNTSIINFAKILTDPTIDVIIGVAWIWTCFAVLCCGYKALKWMIYLTFVIPFIGSIFAMIGMYAMTPDKVPQFWDAVFGSGAFKQLIDSATKNGWKPSMTVFSWGATVSGLIPAIYSSTGPAIAGTFIAGEARRPKTSMLYGTVGSCVLVLAFYLLYIGGGMQGFGLQFVQQLDFGGPALSLTPSVPLLGAVGMAGISIVGVWLVAISTLMAFHEPPAALFMGSRILFGMPFDRTMPAKLAEVNEKTTAPIWNYLVLTILISIAIYFASPLSGVSIFVTLGWTTFTGIFCLVFANLAAILMPFNRRDLFQSADKTVRQSVAGIPVMVIAGLVGFIGYFFSMLVSAFTIANSALGVQALMIPTLFLAVGLLIYVYYVNKGYKSGIDMNMVYKELPPE